MECKECGIILADVTDEADAICGRCVNNCLSDEVDEALEDDMSTEMLAGIVHEATTGSAND